MAEAKFGAVLKMEEIFKPKIVPGRAQFSWE
jgi:hypothetical protein